MINHLISLEKIMKEIGGIDKNKLNKISALKTKCQTPGAQFHTTISSSKIECSIDLPNDLELSNKEAELLEKNIHNALEIVLAKYFFSKNKKD